MRLEPCQFFVLRTPLLPIESLLSWCEATRGSNEASDISQERLSTTRQRSVTQLKELLRSRADVREALYLASPVVDSDLDRWLADSGAPDDKLERTLVRYLQRMAGRATPFGLFAGLSIGNVSSTTCLTLPSSATYKRHTRIDNDYLSLLSELISRRPQFRQHAVYRSNSSLYKNAGRWKYVETVIRFSRQHRLVALAADEYLDCAVERGRSGTTRTALIAALVQTGSGEGFTEDEVVSYVDDLIDRQVLVSDLSPVVTGVEPLDDVITQLEPLGFLGDVVSELKTIAEMLRALDLVPLGVSRDKYEQIADRMLRLCPAAERSRLFQVDLTKTGAPACGADITKTLLDAVEMLHKVAPPVVDHLRRFKDAFVARYDRREVALLEALDEESGIGFGGTGGADHAPLLEGLAFPGPSENPGVWTARDVFLFSKLEEVIRAQSLVLELSSRDVDELSRFTPAPANLPATVTAMAAVESAVGESSGCPRVFVRFASGPGPSLLGRFCHGMADLRAHMQQLIQGDESSSPEAIFAEIVHLPDGRLGNVIARPILRQYEIPYLGRSGAPVEQQIPVQDLMVSVQNDRVVLRSKRLGVEVIPRLATAHNYSRGQGVYRFLGTLQTQLESAWCSWSWGSLDCASFLPRVTYGRAVLSRARWKLRRDLIAAVTAGDTHSQLIAVQTWRQEHRVPRFVALVENDNELFVDLDNVLSVETAVDLVMNKDSVVFVEIFPEPSRLGVAGPEGRFVHELLLPLVRKSDTPVRRRLVPTATVNGVRTFAAGSEWAYLKWYAGSSGLDALLRDVVASAICPHVASGEIAKWFFVRYADPDPHLRIRLNGSPDALRAVVTELDAVALEQLSAGRIWRIQADTYEQELERYGFGEAMALSEQVFWRDSESVLTIVRAFQGDAGLEARWRLCLLSFDYFLDDFGFSVTEKRELAKSAKAALAASIRSNKQLSRSLSNKFRRERKTLEELFDREGANSSPLSQGIAALRSRSILLKPVVHDMRREYANGKLHVPLPSLASSHIHMHANRILRSSNRSQEFVLYDFLERLYVSQIGRARGRGPS